MRTPINDILRTLEERGQWITTHELATVAGLHPEQAERLLLMLERSGLVMLKMDPARSRSNACELVWCASESAFRSMMMTMVSLSPSPGPLNSSGRLSRARICTCTRLC